MTDPISGAVEKKAVDSVFNFLPKLWNKFRRTDRIDAQATQIEQLHKELKVLTDKLDLKAEFERKKAALVRRQEDDNMYVDEYGSHHCPACLDADSKFVGLSNYGDGSYFCVVHKQVFQTEERRHRKEQARPIRFTPRHRPGRAGY